MRLPRWLSFRKLFASALFASVTIGNAIQKIAPNDITKWLKEPEITMSIYAISLIIFIYPWTKKGTIGGTVLIILAIMASALLTWLFSHLWG